MEDEAHPPPSFTSRRPAAHDLPPFSIPSSRSSETPSMQKHPSVDVASASASASAPASSSASRPVPHAPPLQSPGSRAAMSNAASGARGPAPGFPPAGGGAATAPSLHAPPNLPPVSSVLTAQQGGSSDEISPHSAGITTGSSQNSQLGGSTTYGYQTGSWATPGGGTASSFLQNSSANMLSASQTPYAGIGGSRGQQSYSHSSSLHYGGRSPHSSSGADVTQPLPSFAEALHTPYSTVGGGGGGGGGTNLTPPTLPSHGSIPVSISQQQTPSTAPSNTATAAYAYPPASSSYSHTSAYPASSGPGQSPFPHFASHPSPSPGLSTTSSATPRSLPASIPSGMVAPQLSFQTPQRSTLGNYSHHAYHPPHYSTVGGAVMSNLGNPHGPLGMVGPTGYGHSLSHQTHSLYHSTAHGHSHGHHGQQSTQERPFKCDQCTQSFNRNHDLKRHKRIHLAVKPFPCTYCDKSFSRKDALKRHRLVKGCGKTEDGKGRGGNAGDGHDHADVKSESDGTEPSPRVPDFNTRPPPPSG